MGRRKATTMFHRLSAFDHFPIAISCILHLTTNDEGSEGN